MLVNIYMKFHEDTLNGFKYTERTGFCHRTVNYKLQRDVTKEYYTYSRVMVLALCTSSFGA